MLSGALVWQLESVVAGVAKVFGTTFTLHGLGWDEALLLLIISAMIGWIAARWRQCNIYADLHHSKIFGILFSCCF